jgi:hypothetical protein
MNWIRKSAYVVGVNLLVLLALVSVVAILPPLIRDVSAGVKSVYRMVFPKPEKVLRRAGLPVYDKYGWAAKHFTEQSQTTTVYYDHIGWRRGEFRGETITVDADGYRRHDTSRDFRSADIWFFGGSTTWGTGVLDSMTIPAYFQKEASLATFNFGEASYTAHQSLNMLMKAYLSGGRPKYVVFYDGVNEVLSKCRREHGFYSSAQEGRIRERLEARSDTASSLHQVLSPTVEILQAPFRKATARKQGYDCDSNDAKAKMIAQTLIFDWGIAKKSVEDNCGVFVPVLQPVAYLGTPNVSHLEKMQEDQALGRQYQVVYPLIKRLLSEGGVSYFDFTELFDVDDQLYIDFCHVVPEGNEMVVRKLSALVGAR